MNYIEWKYKLTCEIAMLEESEKETILAYYDELFQDKTEEGYSEGDILRAFGKPETVANDLTAGLGTLGECVDTPEYKASRKEKFKENFDKFQENFNAQVNSLLKKMGASIKKFAGYVVEQIDRLDQYHKSRNKSDGDEI